MIGIGSQLLGTTPAGVGQAETVPTLPSYSPGARYIGPDGNPVIDPVNGGFLKADPIAMRLYLAVRTTLKSSSAMPGLGVAWPEKMDARFEANLSNAIRVAIGDLINSRQIRLDGIAITYPQPERYSVTLDYFNLITQKSAQVTV
jgi:hypothetical protein